MTAPGETEQKASMHRVRVGALGLAGVFLLVMLATALLRAAGGDTLDNGVNMVTANSAGAPSEPLAELGVAPGNVPPDQPAKPSAPAQGTPVKP